MRNVVLALVNSFMCMLFLRRACNQWIPGLANAPHYVNIDMASGKISNHWVDSLSAFFAGLQVSMCILCTVIYSVFFFKGSDRRY